MFRIEIVVTAKENQWYIVEVPNGYEYTSIHTSSVASLMCEPQIYGLLDEFMT